MRFISIASFREPGGAAQPHGAGERFTGHAENVLEAEVHAPVS